MSINNLFLFMEKYTICNHAADSSMFYSSPTLQNVLPNLLIDCRIAVEWFHKNEMKERDIELKVDKKYHPRIEYRDSKSKNIIYNNFIRSNFEYCPLALPLLEILITINLKRYMNSRCEFSMIDMLDAIGH